MRVVCDNCGAVYKIADSKLSKEVNRATCKRCGHKIIIYKPGSQAAEDAAARGPEDEAPAETDEERTVIKSVPELKKLVQSQQGVPTIGSLTAELRAISIPGVQPVQGPLPEPALVGAGGASGQVPMGLDSLSGAPAIAVPPMPAPPMPAPPAAPVVMPQVGIPPSDSPSTQFYDGPRAATPGPGARPAVPSSPTPPPLPSLPQAPPVPARGPVTHPPAPPPPVPPGPPLPPRPPTGSQAAVRGPSGAQPVVPPPMAARVAGSPVPSPVTAPAGGAASVLGTVAVLGLLGLAGLLVTPFLAAPINSIAYGLAGFGMAGCLLLALVTERGAQPGRAPIALVVALLLAGLVFGVHYMRGLEAQPIVSVPSLPPVAPPPVVEPDPDLPEELPEEPADAPEDEGSAELSAAEAEELNRFSDSQVSGLGRSPAPAPEPASTPAPRRLVEPEPASTPRATPEPTPKATPKPEGPSRAAVRAPEEEEEAKTSSGPSRFVIDTIMKNNATIIRCLKVEQARGADLSGKIYVKFSISPDGTVSRARVTTSRFSGTALDTCISNEVNSLKFPPYEGKSKQITYPLIVE
jgi:predicted Zn finger-like uncharacterized protein